MKLKNISGFANLLLAVLLIFTSCQKDDSAKDYGFSLIYMPQSINTASEVDRLYAVPRSSNNASPTGMNYIVDQVNQTTNIILGVALSGSAAGAYSVDVVVDNNLTQELINTGNFGANYMLMPDTGYSIPAKLEVSDKGYATFNLAVKNTVIVDPAYFGKHLLLAVTIANPSQYEIQSTRATTIVDLDIEALFPNATGTSEINVEEGVTITITGQNLDQVTSLNFTGTNITIPVVSQKSNELVVTMPEMNAFNRGAIDLVTPFGTTKSSFELVNVNNAMQVFTDGYGINIGPNTDGDDYGSSQAVSTTVAKRGNASLAITYFGNNYSPGGILNGEGFINDGYQYITFWARSTTNGTGNEGIQLSLMGSGMPDGYGNDFAGVGIVVSPQWTYYKIPIGPGSGKPMWNNGNNFRKFGWRLNNWNVPDNEVIYFDDILFVK
jgi:hypothetical protein